uniref:Conserved hypothetical plastid protein n=1 Tax=Calliarthron tuberculosum TaxID=48942 RepID=M4ITX0_CALTB|nr:conserved hypothetical plastid protein [Calliarthron tuberculosum]AGA63911.1 conserved hypothetical plastid protein [Calliarthron tuberculosum]
MILFNLIFSQNITELYSMNSHINMTSVNFLHKSLKPRSSLAFILCDIKNLSKSKEDLASSNLLNSNLWRKFINTFWYQIVFLSTSNKLSEKYQAQLNSLNVTGGKNNYKRLLSQFSKSLTNNSIRSSLEYHKDDYSSDNLKYVWYKGLNFSRMQLFESLFKTDIRKGQLINLKNKLKNNIGFNSMPLYTVSNHLGQMIISEQTEELNSGFLFSSKNTNDWYKGWFFINFEDAKEYMYHIEKYYGLNNELKIVSCNLETFYKISSIYNKQLLLRLVPDLNEVGNLISKYKNYNNIEFHQKQNYGKNFFQGQPLYMIKTSMHSNSQNQYYYKIFLNKKHKNYITLFTNYETAINTLNKLKLSNSVSLKANNTKLIVYNLENFLQDSIDYSSKNKNFLLVPSKSSYKYLKTNQQQQARSIISSDLSERFLFFKLWTKRILWSLTSRQPIN